MSFTHCAQWPGGGGPRTASTPRVRKRSLQTGEGRGPKSPGRHASGVRSRRTSFYDLCFTSYHHPVLQTRKQMLRKFRETVQVTQLRRGRASPPVSTPFAGTTTLLASGDQTRGSGMLRRKRHVDNRGPKMGPQESTRSCEYKAYPVPPVLGKFMRPKEERLGSGMSILGSWEDM